MKHPRLETHGAGVGLGIAATILAGLLTLHAVPAQAGVDVHIDIGNAPPPPTIVFQARPHRVYDSSTRVYVVDDPGVGDNDCFYYGGNYWLFTDGYWYRSRTWRGGFVVVQPRAVPTVFYRVPERRWKHRPNGPPGLANKPGRMPPGQYKKDGGGPPGQDKKHGR
jgi:hypothetical protein